MKKTEKNNPTVSSEIQSDTQPGRKWHNFLIYFALFAAAIVNAVNGVLNLTGYKYNINSYFSNAVMLGEQMHYYYPATKIIDTAYGVILILMAVYQILIRQMLKKGKKRAVFHLNATIVIMCSAVSFYDCLFAALVQNQKYVLATISYAAPVTTVWTAALIGGGLCVFNMVYYKSRADLICVKK